MKPFWTIKTVKGKRYIYRETREREGARVVSKSAYIMPAELWGRALKIAGKKYDAWGPPRKAVSPTVLGAAIRKARKPGERRLLRAAFSRLARLDGKGVRQTFRRYVKTPPRHKKLSRLEATQRAYYRACDRFDEHTAALLRRFIPPSMW